MIGIHINLMMAAGRDPSSFPNPTEEERQYLSELAHWTAKRPVINGSRAPARRHLPSASRIHPPAWRRGSWKNSAPGPIAMATSRA